MLRKQGAGLSPDPLPHIVDLGVTHSYRGFTKFSWSSCSTPPEATPVVSIKA